MQFQGFSVKQYHSPSKLYIKGVHILSIEGTTQGDPLGMAMFAIGTLPLIQQILGTPTMQQPEGHLLPCEAGGIDYRQWVQVLDTTPTPAKPGQSLRQTINRGLIEESFQDTGIKITIQGSRILGAALGTRSFVEKFVCLICLCWLRRTHRQLTQCSPTVCPVSGPSSCAQSRIGALFQPLEDEIRQFFLPAITGRQALSDTEREFVAVPARLGGLGGSNQDCILSVQIFNKDI